MNITDIIKEVPQEVQVELKVLHNAVFSTTKSYKEDPTRSRLADWQAAKAALADEIEAVAEKYDLDIDGRDVLPEGSPAVDWKLYEDTRNKADVLRFLEETGWEIKKQTFYNHCSDGKLTKNRNGLYTKRKVKKYAETWLIRSVSGKSVSEESEDLAASKTRAEIRRINTIEAREKIKLDVEKGKYILRSDVEAQLAGRAVMFDNGLTHLFQSSIADMIGIVAGDQKRSADLIAFLMEKKDSLLNEYATMDQFQVVFDETCNQ